MLCVHFDRKKFRKLERLVFKTGFFLLHAYYSYAFRMQNQNKQYHVTNEVVIIKHFEMSIKQMEISN